MKPKDIFDQVKLANPALEFSFITIWDDGEIATQPTNSSNRISAQSFDEFCAKLAETKIESPSEKLARELADIEKLADDKRAELAKITNQN